MINHKEKVGDKEDRLLLQEEIDFLGSMRFYKEDAILDNNYMEKCYDIFMRTWD